MIFELQTMGKQASTFRSELNFRVADIEITK